MEKRTTNQRKPYEKPEVVFVGSLEAYAAVCDKASTTEPGCLGGTIKS